MLNQKISQRSTDVILGNLLRDFGKNLMVIYREILQERRVIVFSRKIRISELNKTLEAIRSMFLPFDFSQTFFPFETLTSIKLLRLEKSFVAAFTNPIIKR